MMAWLKFDVHRPTVMLWVVVVVVMETVVMWSGGCSGAANSRPIIGVLTQPTTHSPSFQSFGRSYLPADYVKWLEAAGARVVPVDYGASKEHLRHLFESVNGILFTGGGLDLPGSLYLRNSMLLYQWAIEANNKGDHYPLWGTCQGFEMFAIIASGNDSVLGSFSGENLTLSLDFTSQARNSRMFGRLPADVYETFAMKPITQNLHHLGVSPQSFLENRGLGKAYAVLSVNKDTNGKIFVSSMEGKDYPFLATQFHPERNAYEWDVNELMDHTADGITAMQWLARVFVEEARQNNHRFRSVAEESKQLIYNVPVVYTADVNPSYEQTYFWSV